MAPSLVKSGFILGLAFILNLLLLYSLAKLLSNQVKDSIALKFPLNIKDISELVSDVMTVKDEHWTLVMILFCFTYLFKQTFSIPGSFLLNLFAGAVFDVWIGLPLVCILSATGASMCFFLSKLLGQDLVKAYLSDRIAPLRDKIRGQEGLSELLLLLSMRLFPATPNWLLNISLPHIGVNPIKFYISVLLGLGPYNFLSIQAGLLLRYSTSDEFNSDIMSYKTFSILTLLSVALVIVAVGMRKVKKS